MDLLMINMQIQRPPMTLEPIPEQVSESLDLTAVIAMNKQPQFQSNLAKGYLAYLKSKPLVLPLVPDQMLLMLHNQSVLLDGPLKTRRQRVVEQISFETDCHNIYDPYFTSEDNHSSNQELPLTTRRRKEQVPYEESSSLGSQFSSSNSSLIDQHPLLGMKESSSSLSSID